jgi:hypothetical protein
MSRSVARNARDKMAKHDTHPDIDLQEVTNLVSQLSAEVLRLREGAVGKLAR